MTIKFIMSDSPQTLDVERELAALRERVRGVNASKASAEMTPLQKAISGVNANWHLSGKLPAPANAPLLWRASHFGKRVARRVMVEVLNTIVEQQNSFNVQAARALTELARENAELRARLAELEKKMSQ